MCPLIRTQVALPSVAASLQPVLGPTGTVQTDSNGNPCFTDIGLEHAGLGSGPGGALVPGDVLMLPLTIAYGAYVMTNANVVVHVCR
jgi:hypothetical protein